MFTKLGQKFKSHINYRDSKLTRILQKSLESNSQIAVICTINQNSQNYHESQVTLNFGIKAKQIRTNAQVNEIVQECPEQIATKIADMTLEIENLKD